MNRLPAIAVRLALLGTVLNVLLLVLALATGITALVFSLSLLLSFLVAVVSLGGQLATPIELSKRLGSMLTGSPVWARMLWATMLGLTVLAFARPSWFTAGTANEVNILYFGMTAVYLSLTFTLMAWSAVRHNVAERTP